MARIGSLVRHVWDDRPDPLTGRLVSRLDRDRWLVRWDPPSGAVSAVTSDDIVELAVRPPAPVLTPR